MARVTGADPQLIRAFYLSVAAHGGLVVMATLASLLIAGTPKYLGAEVYGVDLLSVGPGSKLMNVGPLGKKAGPPAKPKAVLKPKAVVKPKPPPKPEPKPEPVVKPKPTPKPKPVPKPEPAPAPKPKPVPKPEPAPAPKPKPAPAPQPKPVAKPEPRPEPKPAVKPKPEAQPQTATPRPSEPSAPAAPGSGNSASPASAPGGGGGGQFSAYAAYMVRTIKDAWVWRGGGSPDLAVVVGFSILGEGRLARIRIIKPSADSHFDQSVLNALRSIKALSPPPARARADFEDVQLVFRPGDANQ